ncbi:hypothetical protein V2J09_000978 [Rumex salicifolius]
MDSYESARAVFSRIQSVDTDNASRIIAYILLQDQAEKEMRRLAFGPENLIRSVINVAKAELGISSNNSSAPNCSPSSSLFSPVSNPISISRPSSRSLSLPSPRQAHTGFNPSSSSSPSIWSISGSSNHRSLSPESNHSPSYAAVVNGTGSVNGSLPSPMSSSARNRANFADEYQFQDQNLSFLNDPPKNTDFLDQSSEISSSTGSIWGNGGGFESEYPFHRRSCSVNDGFLGTDDSTSGFKYKPCYHFTKGFCKHGSTCNFVHGGAGFPDSGDNCSAIVGSPCNFDAPEQCQQELMRSKLAQQQRLVASNYMAGVNSPCNKLNFLQSEVQRFRRNYFSGLNYGDSNPVSRQIYLTFPADSSFKEEDVSSYFSIYGPVQDVRIPYQQKRMFGFVTFLYPETVKIILAKGNPHFVCDSRVLVKPYKEKGKLLDKKQQQDRSEFSSCGSPSGMDCREPFEMHVGPRMYQSNQEMMLRKKLEQEFDLHQALELQSRRLMNLKFLDLNRYQQNLPAGSPPHVQNQNIPSGGIYNDNLEDNNTGSPNGSPTKQLHEEEEDASCHINGIIKEDSPKLEEASDLPESMEHVLPEGLFASPTKFSAEDGSVFASKPATVTSFISCFRELPRYALNKS